MGFSYRKEGKRSFWARGVATPQETARTMARAKAQGERHGTVRLAERMD